jgi:hypothetical protein
MQMLHLLLLAKPAVSKHLYMQMVSKNEVLLH